MQSAAEFDRLALHDVRVGIREEMIATNGEFQLPIGGVYRTEITKLTNFVRETTLVIRSGDVGLEERLIKNRMNFGNHRACIYRYKPRAWISKGSCFGIMIDKVDLPLFGVLHFKAFR